MDTLVLSTPDLRRIVAHVGLDALLFDVVEALETACLDHDQRGFDIPPRSGLVNAKGLLEWMPVAERGHRATVKLVSYYPDNPREQQLPTILSVALSFDASTGQLLALSDATFATALRTGAASLIASRVLASPETRTLGLIGAGAQAVAQYHALSRHFDFDEVRVYDIDSQVSGTFERRVLPLGLNGTQVSVTALERVIGADIICTATSVAEAAGPVFEDEGLAPHVHINAVGADFPGKTEVPLSLLRRSMVAVDFLPQAQREGEAQRLEAHEIGPDLVHLIQGADQFAAHRLRPTVFDSTGFALEDHAVIDVLCRHALDIGCGTYCEIESAGSDAVDPYRFLQDGTHGIRGEV